MELNIELIDYNPDTIITGQFQYTFKDIMEMFSEQFRDMLFTIWLLYAIYIYVNNNTHKMNEKQLKIWDQYSHHIILMLTLIYPIIYIYSGYWLW